ncbi:MAG: hypothetical protein AAF662_14265 [Pseudomonadota bacterium]
MRPDDQTVHTLSSDLISGFTLDSDGYQPLGSGQFKTLELNDNASTSVQLFGMDERLDLELRLTSRGQGNRVFLGPGVRGILTLNIDGSDSNVFIGRDVRFSDQIIGSRQDNDWIAIGNDVATTGPGRWISGLRCPKSVRPALIIGDACVFARDVVLRNSDGHPFFDLRLKEQVAAMDSHLVIEPHCWIGERAAVIKPVRIGAFAVLGFGSVVTSPVPRHHTASGNPARVRRNDMKVWCWDDTDDGIDRAAQYLARYPYLPDSEA